MFGQRNFLITGQQAVEYPAHLITQLYIQPGQVLIHPQHPCLHALEYAAHLQARGFTFHDIGFKAARQLFVVRPLLLEGKRIPCLQISQAQPVQRCLHIRQMLPLAQAQRFATRCLGFQRIGDIQPGVQEVMPQLVDGGGEVGILQQGNSVAARHKCTTCRLVQNTVIPRIKRPAVIGGGFDLVGLKDSKRSSVFGFY